jgi:N-acetylglucosaminyldiphosphoundecaprenol N-acetyl-beta-D-mannosaminyltransferase
VTSDCKFMLGFGIFAGDARRCVASISAWVAAGDGPRWLACLNPHSWVEARHRPDFARALEAADWLVPDGAGLTLASRILDAGLGGRVTGADVFEGLSRRLDERGGAKVFFLGATEETLALVRERYQRDYPRLRVVGTYAPPFREEFQEDDFEAMAAAVNASGADVVWVGLGAPKQELAILRLRPRLQVRFVAAIGAVFDFYSGRVRRASPLLRRLGLEWLARLVREPVRLWRRMFVSAPVFLWHVARARLAAARG